MITALARRGGENDRCIRGPPMQDASTGPRAEGGATGVARARAAVECHPEPDRRGEVELRERARQQEAVAALGELALNAEDLEGLFRAAVRMVRDALHARRVHLLELSADGTRLAHRSESGPGEALPAGGIPTASATPAALALAAGATFVSADAARDPRLGPAGAALGPASVTSAVVRGRARPFGVLCAHGARPACPTPDEVHFVETVANMLSAAVARCEAEQELAARERELRAVFDATQDALVTTDDAGRLTAANRAAQQLFRRGLEDLAGREIFELCGCARGMDAQERWAELQATGRTAGDAELLLPGAPPRALAWNAVAGILPGRHLFVVRDVTEERLVQARLALADRMASVGTLAAGVAHELNNPLAYVSGNLAFIARQLEDGGEAPATEEIREALRDAREGAARMKDIIRDLRIFSRPDTVRTAGPVDVLPVLESALNLAANEIRHRARLVKDLAPVPHVCATEARLGQVFLNLIVNAAQAIRAGAADRNEIAVRTRVEADGRVAIEVSDTGCGIPREHLHRVFDPFFTTKPAGEGTGLGLSICHRIVSDFGGSLEVKSAPGRGATFLVRLPAAAAPAAAPDAPAPPAPLPAPERVRVLVVDDEPLVGSTLRRILSADHDVTVVGGGREALDLLARGERFHVVVSDLLMPGMTGMDLHREVARLHGPLADRMVFTTGGACTPDAQEFVERNRCRCLVKPFERAALREAIRAALAAPGGQP